MKATQRRAESAFGLLVLLVLLVVLGYRVVWQQLPHRLPAGKLALDAQRSASNARLARLLLDSAGQGRVTTIYFRTLLEDLDEQLRDEMTTYEHLSPEPAARPAFEAYRTAQGELESVLGALSSPARQPAFDAAMAQRLERVATTLTALGRQP